MFKKEGLYLLFVIILGILFPYGTVFDFLLVPFLMLILFLAFIKIDLKFPRFYFKEILSVFIGLFLTAGIAFFVGKFLNLPLSWHIGLVLAALTPTALGSPIIVNLAKGNLMLITQSILATNFATILYLPAFIYLFFQKEIVIDPILIGEKILILLIIPFLIAFILKKTKKDAYIKNISSHIAFPLLCFLIWIVISKNSERILDAFFNYSWYFLIIALLTILNYSLGYIISFSKNKTVSIALGHKNTVMTIWIALAFFDPVVALVPTIYLICHHVVNSMILYGKYDD